LKLLASTCGVFVPAPGISGREAVFSLGLSVAVALGIAVACRILLHGVNLLL